MTRLISAHPRLRAEVSIASPRDVLVPGVATMLAAHVESGRLAILDFLPPEIRARYSIIALRGRTPSPTALAITRMLLEVETEMTEGEASSDRHSARKKPRPRRNR